MLERWGETAELGDDFHTQVIISSIINRKILIIPALGLHVFECYKTFAVLGCIIYLGVVKCCPTLFAEMSPMQPHAFSGVMSEVLIQTCNVISSQGPSLWAAQLVMCERSRFVQMVCRSSRAALCLSLPFCCVTPTNTGCFSLWLTWPWHVVSSYSMWQPW